jgi:hypothetical protein
MKRFQFLKLANLKWIKKNHFKMNLKHSLGWITKP